MSSTVIGILSPGEMGSSIGARLEQAGFQVVTTLPDRSQATQNRAQAIGMLLLEDWDALVQLADLIISVVPPAAARPLAETVASALVRAGTHPFYVDANAIEPESSAQIGAILSNAGARYVDGSIIGNAADWEHRTRLYLSGPEADQVHGLLAPALHVERLGHTVGLASALKILYAGLTKGLSALGMELLAGAAQLGITEKLLQTYAETFPDIVQFLKTTLPGLPHRAERRSQEMVELATLLDRHSLVPHMSTAAAAALSLLAQGRNRTPPPPDSHALDRVIQWWITSNPKNLAAAKPSDISRQP